MATHSGSRVDRQVASGRAPTATPKRAAAVVVLLLCGIAVFSLTWLCNRLLGSASAGHAIGSGELLLYVAAATFLFAAGSVVMLQALRMERRMAGPEHRLIDALQRIRSGDVSFRVHLRRGDLLSGLAAECNHLLDWLNDNPPNGVRTGSDMVEVGNDGNELLEVDS